jgi:hypothetical protein
VYVEVPKVACSSIKIVLAGLVGVDLRAVGGNPHEAVFPEAPDPIPGPKACPGMFSFAFVRNPWDRLVSCYRDKILGQAPDFTGFHPARQVAYSLARFDVFKAGMPFEGFVEAVSDIPDVDADGPFRSQHTFVSNGSGDIVLDFVGRFESLQSDSIQFAESSTSLVRIFRAYRSRCLQPDTRSSIRDARGITSRIAFTPIWRFLVTSSATCGMCEASY